MKIEVKKLKLSEIKLNPNNPRQITEKELDKLVRSLKEFPEMRKIREIVVDEDMMILGGNMRFRALQIIGEKSDTVKVVSGLTDEQKREFIIKDNSAFGVWDFDVLANEWDGLPLNDWGVDLPEDWLLTIPEDNKDIDEDAMAETQNECPSCGFKW